MKKALSAAMAAGMTAVMLAGCGSSASSAAESTAPAESTSAAASTEAAAESVVSAPTALSFVFADGDDTFKTQMNKIVDDFNAANPDITITIEPGDGGSYSEFLKTKDSVGEFPDMMETLYYTHLDVYKRQAANTARQYRHRPPAPCGAGWWGRRLPL